MHLWTWFGALEYCNVETVQGFPQTAATTLERQCLTEYAVGARWTSIRSKWTKINHENLKTY